MQETSAKIGESTTISHSISQEAAAGADPQGDYAPPPHPQAAFRAAPVPKEEEEEEVEAQVDLHWG
jgi:hypothetical protein